jgi:hypothetical protein
MNGWTVARTIETARSNRFFQLAPDLSDNPPDGDVMFHEKTCCNFWRNFISVDGPWFANETVAPAPEKEFCIDTAFIRLDAAYVLSTIRILRRNGLFRAFISTSLREFGNTYPRWIGEEDLELRNRYDGTRDRSEVAADSLRSTFDTGATYSGGKKLKSRSAHIAEIRTRERKSRFGVPSVNVMIYCSTEGRR